MTPTEVAYRGDLDLDARIHRLRGYAPHPTEKGWWVDGKGTESPLPPPYSGSIAVAWELVEEAAPLELMLWRDAGGWNARLYRVLTRGAEQSCYEVLDAATAPLAIARAYEAAREAMR